jgi:hypothetical protein
MTLTAPPTTLADRFAWFFDGLCRAIESEAAKRGIESDSCAEGRWGWLAAPVALLTRMLARRRRKEAELAAEQVRMLMEQFVALLKQAEEEREAAPPTEQGCDILEMPAVIPTDNTAPLRFSAPSAVRNPDRRGRKEAQRVCPAADVRMIAEAPRVGEAVAKSMPADCPPVHSPLERSLAAEMCGIWPPWRADAKITWSIRGIMCAHIVTIS